MDALDLDGVQNGPTSGFGGIVQKPTTPAGPRRGPAMGKGACLGNECLPGATQGGLPGQIKHQVAALDLKGSI